MALQTTFINAPRLYSLIEGKAPEESRVRELCEKARLLKGITTAEAAELLQVENKEHLQLIMETARDIKDIIYGRRLVLFAPLYTGNKCSNNCLYCAFRSANSGLTRSILTMDEITKETEELLRQGHKRILMLCGESGENPLSYVMEALKTVYDARLGEANIRRINVEIAPLTVEEFKTLKTGGIGTYACFQETYDPLLYAKYHLSGPKANYQNRLYVMHRAMEGGIDDVGIGALFGLADYRFETLALIEHARNLEETFGVGPHTVSVPRIEPAEGSPLSENIPYRVTDNNFKKLIAVLRITLPYTGIILTTRETETLRNELFSYGVSQISAGSRTNPGAYRDSSYKEGSQFSLGDHRTLEEVISTLIEKKYIPSFCTGCYRKGRVGQDFMDLAKPGLIHEFCMPNGLFTFAEYLLDFASQATREKGFALINELTSAIPQQSLKDKVAGHLHDIKSGERDVYL